MPSALGTVFTQLLAARRLQKELETEAATLYRQRNRAEGSVDAAHDKLLAAKEKWGTETWRPQLEDAEADVVDAEEALDDVLKRQSAIWSEMKKTSEAIQRLQEHMRALK